MSGDENLILLLDLLDKMGYSGEAAGAATMFQNMERLNALIGTANPASGDLLTLFKGLKLISDYVDTIEAKLGLNSDAAGTTTLFARLAQIAGYTDQVEGYVDTVEALLGTANPASGGTDTLFKYLWTVQDKVNDTQVNRVGSNSDAASTTGSANAKLAALLQRTGGGTPNIFVSQTTSTTYSTLCTIAGSGMLLSAGLCYAQSTGGLNMRITIDGVQRFSGTIAVAGSSSTDNVGIICGQIRFSSSLLIEIAQITASTTYPCAGIATVLTGVA